MTSGRVLAQRALREPMRAHGWTQRAAGWFTKTLAPGMLGVVAVGAASRYTAPGTALITLHLGLRDETTEQILSRLLGWKDQGYRQRTATTSIGYLLPGRAWRDWLFAPSNAPDRAEELASAVHAHGEPYLRALVFDRAGLLAAAKASPDSIQAIGPCRIAVMLAQHGDRDQATAFVDERISRLGTRTDTVADSERESARRVRAWLQAT